MLEFNIKLNILQTAHVVKLEAWLRTDFTRVVLQKMPLELIPPVQVAKVEKDSLPRLFHLCTMRVEVNLL